MDAVGYQSPVFRTSTSQEYAGGADCAVGAPQSSVQIVVSVKGVSLGQAGAVIAVEAEQV